MFPLPGTPNLVSFGHSYTVRIFALGETGALACGGAQVNSATLAVNTCLAEM